MKREHLIIKWILRVTHADKNSSIDFADWISDGNILSRYVAYLNFPAKKKIWYDFFRQNHVHLMFQFRGTWPMGNFWMQSRGAKVCFKYIWIFPLKENNTWIFPPKKFNWLYFFRQNQRCSNTNNWLWSTWKICI